jgi:hypothetical protein
MSDDSNKGNWDLSEAYKGLVRLRSNGSSSYHVDQILDHRQAVGKGSAGSITSRLPHDGTGRSTGSNVGGGTAIARLSAIHQHAHLRSQGQELLQSIQPAVQAVLAGGTQMGSQGAVLLCSGGNKTGCSSSSNGEAQIPMAPAPAFNFKTRQFEEVQPQETEKHSSSDESYLDNNSFTLLAPLLLQQVPNGLRSLSNYVSSQHLLFVHTV